MHRDDTHRSCSQPCSLQGPGTVFPPSLVRPPTMTSVRGWKVPGSDPGLLLEQPLPSTLSPGKEGEPRWKAQPPPSQESGGGSRASCLLQNVRSLGARFYCCPRVMEVPWAPTCVSVKQQRSCRNRAVIPNSYLRSVGCLAALNS